MKSIDTRFEQFHRENPQVLKELVEMCCQHEERRPGQRKSIAQMFEVLRWNVALRTTGEAFKLNNTYRSRYARLLTTLGYGPFELRAIKERTGA